MPADLVTGQDAEDVAPTSPASPACPARNRLRWAPPAEVFAEKCGMLATLQAGTGDGTGPNLGDSLAGKDADTSSSRSCPNSRVAKGFSEGVMPVDFKQTIPKQKPRGPGRLHPRPGAEGRLGRRLPGGRGLSA